MTDEWQSVLYDGLLDTGRGKPTTVLSGFYNKPMHEQKMRDEFINTPDIVSMNPQSRGITPRKNKFGNYTHRMTAFLPQE
jgi:hypothetical protein